MREVWLHGYLTAPSTERLVKAAQQGWIVYSAYLLDDGRKHYDLMRRVDD